MKHFITHFTREFKRHLFDYLTLTSLGVLFLLLLRLYRGNRTNSFITAVSFCTLYIIWGMYHHYKLGNLHMKNIVEYILIAFTFLFLLKVLLVI